MTRSGIDRYDGPATLQNSMINDAAAIARPERHYDFGDRARAREPTVLSVSELCL